MSIVEIRGGPVTLKHLMRKSKTDLAYEVLDLLREIEKRDAKIMHLESVIGDRFEQ